MSIVALALTASTKPDAPTEADKNPPTSSGTLATGTGVGEVCTTEKWKEAFAIPRAVSRLDCASAVTTAARLGLGSALALPEASAGKPKSVCRTSMERVLRRPCGAPPRKNVLSLAVNA